MRFIKLAILASLFVAASASAGNIERGSDGSVRILQVNPVIYTPLDITVTPEALAYGDLWKQSLVSGGVVSAEQQKIEWATKGLFYKTKTIVATVGIVYDKSAKRVDVVKNAVLSSEKSFNPSLIFWAVAMIAMTVFVASVRQRHYNKSNAVAAIFVVAALTAFGSIVAIISSAVVVVVACFAFVSAVAVFSLAAKNFRNNKKKKAYMGACILFYLFMVAIVIFQYQPYR